MYQARRPLLFDADRSTGGTMFKLIALILAVSAGLISPANAAPVLETGGDATRMVSTLDRPAPQAWADIVRASWTTGDTAYTLDLTMRELRTRSTDQLFVNLDTNGDGSPDQGLRWERGGELRFFDVHGAYNDEAGSAYGYSDAIACFPTVTRVFAHDTIRVIIPTDCVPSTPAALQVTAYNDIERDTPRGYVTASWDYVGGAASMVELP